MAPKKIQPSSMDPFPLPESDTFRDAEAMVNDFYQKKFALPEVEQYEGLQDLREGYRLGDFPEDIKTEKALQGQTQRPMFNKLKQERMDALPGLELDEQDDISIQPSLTQKILGPLERAYKSATGQPEPSKLPASPLPDFPPGPRAPQAKTKEGRAILKNPDGSISTEETITVEDPFNPGKYVNIPTIYQGKRVSDDKAIEIFAKSGGVDPDTGIKLEPHETIDQAEQAARARSEMLGQQYAPTPPGALPSLSNELREMRKVFDETRQPHPLPDITQQKVVESTGGLDAFLGKLPFGGFLQSPEAQLNRKDEAQLSDAPRKPEELGSFQKGVGRGILNTGAQFLAGGAAVAHGLGAEETAEGWMQSYEKLTDEAEKFRGVQFGEAFESPGKFVSWAAGAIGEQTPVIASLLVSGGVGAVMGRVAAAGAMGRASKILTSEQARQVAKWGARTGQATAATAMTALEGGGIYGEQRKAGVEPNPGLALAGGAINGVLETVVPFTLLRTLQAEKLAGPFMNDLLKKLGTMGILPRIMATVGGTAASEGLTEGLQEEVAIQARALVDEKYERLGQEAMDRRKEAAATGMLVGGIFGGAGGAMIPSQEAQPGLPGQGQPQPRTGPTPLYNLGEPLPPINLPQTVNNLGAFEGQQPQVQGPPIAVPLQEEEVIPESIMPAIPPQPPMAVQPEPVEPEPVLPVQEEPLPPMPAMESVQPQPESMTKPQEVAPIEEPIVKPIPEKLPKPQEVVPETPAIQEEPLPEQPAVEPIPPSVNSDLEQEKEEGKQKSISSGDDISGMAWRAETGYKHGRDVTGQDVIRYEAEESGNSYIAEEAQKSGIDLSGVPANKLVWVTKERESASRYGDPEEFELPVGSKVIVPDDGDGGTLILLPWKKPNKNQPEPLPSIEAKKPEKEQISPPPYSVQPEPLPEMTQPKAANKAQMIPTRAGMMIQELDENDNPIGQPYLPGKKPKAEQEKPAVKPVPLPPLEKPTPETSQPVQVPIPSATAVEQIAKASETEQPVDLVNPAQVTPDRRRKVFLGKNGQRDIHFPNEYHAELFDFASKLNKKIKGEIEFDSKHAASRLREKLNLPEDAQIGGYSQAYRKLVMDAAKNTKKGEPLQAPEFNRQALEDSLKEQPQTEINQKNEPVQQPSPLPNRDSVLPNVKAETKPQKKPSFSATDIINEFEEGSKEDGAQAEPLPEVKAVAKKEEAKQDDQDIIPLDDFLETMKPGARVQFKDTSTQGEGKFREGTVKSQTPRGINIIPDDNQVLYSIPIIGIDSLRRNDGLRAITKTPSTSAEKPDTLKPATKEPANGEATDSKPAESRPEPTRDGATETPTEPKPKPVPRTEDKGVVEPVPSERPGSSADNDGPATGERGKPGHGEGVSEKPPVSEPTKQPDKDKTPAKDTPQTDDGERLTPEADQSAVEQEITPPQTAEPNPARAALLDYHIQEQDQLEEGGKKTKYRRNVDAIKLLKELEKEGRLASPEEQATLVRYTGWGGVAEAFRYSRDWDKEYSELEELLTADEYRAAKASTQFAHYTSPGVIRGMWSAMEHLGFTKGRILEPGAGIGHFFGLMPKGMVKGSSRTAIEIDSLSGRFLKQLYQGSNVEITPFQDASLPDNFFDMAISNVPFSDAKPYGSTDKELNRLGFSLHDYYFAKSLKKVRTGGLVAFITSRYTMDKQSPVLRDYVAERADFLGAIRLPNNAFKGIAATEVTTDIIFLQKRPEGTKAGGAEWKSSIPTEMSKKDGGTDKANLNEYFIRNPHMMLGKMTLTGSMHGPAEPTLEPDGRDLFNAIEEASKKLPAKIIQAHVAPKATTQEGSLERLPAPGDVKESAFVVKDGQLYIKQGTDLVPQPNTPATQIARVESMIGVRDVLRDVFRTQLEDQDNDSIVKARKVLNTVYDKFVKKHGFINTQGNRLAFQTDPDFPALSSLEKWDRATKTATKEAIFSKRTIEPRRPIEKVETAKEGLLASLNEHGGIDMPYMTAITGKPEAQIVDELGDLVYNNPEGTWEHKEEYLSGNVKRKLKAAEIAAKADARFERNVNALKAVVPEDLKPTQISVTLGVGWIPVNDVQQFVKETLGIYHRPAMAYIEALGMWQVGEVQHGDHQAWRTPRRNVTEILEATLNLQTLVVKNSPKDGGGTNHEATVDAQAKQAKWKEAFEEWVWKDPARAVRLAKKYNEEFNHTALRQYDGSHLTLPGSNPGVVLRAHQKDAIWRILQTGNTLLGHQVGTGKTFTMIGAAMESRRIGLAKKPVMTVLKSTLEQFKNEFIRLYPAANLLVPTTQDFHKDNRKKLIAKIATGDWDAILISHEQLSRIPLDKATEKAYLDEQIAILEDYILREQEEGNGPSTKSTKRNKTVKELEKAKARLEAKLKKRMDAVEDDGVTFEQSGIDMLLVDEADQFKNLFFPSRMTRVSGLSNSDAKRSSDLYMKTRYLSKINNGRNVVFATGTPISNTIAEAFTMQRFLQQEALDARGMEHFDAWARFFATTKTEVELSPTGKWRQATSFSRFLNVPDMMQMFGNVLDIRFAEDLHLDIPPMRTGAPINIVAEPSEALKAYMATLVERAEHLPDDPRIDNPLKITTDSRHAALDLRLRVKGVPDDPGGKVNLAVNQIAEDYQKWDKHKGTQLVFLDLSTPKGKSDTETETEETTDEEEIETEEEAQARDSIYADIRAKLIKTGIPSNQIAFIHDAKTDAQRINLYTRMNSGDLRVLMGTTNKLGTGVNVQARLVALHHIDAPWRPRDIEQREGRILRQGNLLYDEFKKAKKPFEISVYRYATKAPSFDVRMWQTIERKARGIHQLMHYDPNVREVEDVGLSILSAAEMKAIASGNPLIYEKVELDNSVMKLRALKRAHDNEIFTVRQRLAESQNAITYHERMIGESKKIAEFLKANEPKKDEFTITIGKQTFTERADAWKALESVVKDAIEKKEPGDEKAIGTFYGTPLLMGDAKMRMQATGTGKDDVEYSPTASLALQPFPEMFAIRTTTNKAGRGQLQSLESLIKGRQDAPAYHEEKLKQAKTDAEILSKRVDEPFKDAEKLERSRKRLAEIDAALSKNEPVQTMPDDDPEPPGPKGKKPKKKEVEDEEDFGAPDTTNEEGGEEEEADDAEEFGFPDILGAKKGSKKYAGPNPRIQPAPITGSKPKPLRDILAKASKDLDQKIWRGKVPKNLAGVYIPKSKVVLFKYANNLDLAAHELAHALDRRFDLLGPPHMRNTYNFELSKFWQHGSVTKSGPRAKLAYRQAEGVAEWMRAYLVNPQATLQAAPGFTPFALSRLPQEVKDSLKEFGEEIRTFAGSAGLEQIKANIEQEGPLPPIRDRIKETLKPSAPGFQLKWTDRMAARWSDDLAPMLRAFEYARKQSGDEKTPLLPKDDPRVMARLFMGMNSMVEDTIKFGVPIANKPADKRATGGGFAWLMEPIPHDSLEELEQGKLDLSAYMIAERTLEKADEFGRDTHISGIGGGLASDVSVAKRTIQELSQDPAKEAWLKEGAKRYRQWADANLRYLVDHGRMSEDQYQAIKDANEYYVAMHRIVEVTPHEEIVVMMPRTAQGRHSKLGAAKQVVKSFKGSDLTIKDPYVTLLDVTSQSLREADRNHVLRSIVKALDLDPSQVASVGPDVDMGTIGRIAKEGEKHTIPIYKDGEKQIWQFHPEVFRALKGLVDGQVKLSRWFTGLPSLMRASIVYAPTFAAKNPIRDAFHRAVLSESKSKPWDSLKRYSAMEISALKRYGGDQAGHYFTDEKQYQRAMKAAMEEIAGKDGHTIVIAAHKLGRGYMELMQMSERQGRLAEYRRAYKQANTEGVDLGDGQKTILDDYNAGLWASSQARGLIDYAVSGEYMRWINQLVVFSNAAVQGVRVYAKAIKDRPTKIMTRTMTWAVIPALIVYAMNAASDDLDEFRQISPWQRDLFYNFKIGPDRWVAIPKSFEIGLVASSFERLADYLNGNKNAFEGHVGQFFETMMPIDTAALAGPYQGLMQAVANFDFFRQRDIVPFYEKDLSLDRRKTWRASRLGQVLQEIFGIDARKIDFLAKAQFGYFGQYATKLSDAGRPERQGLGLSDTGFFRGSPASHSVDVDWLAKKAKETGAASSKAYKSFRGNLDAYYDATSQEAKDRHGHIIRREAKKLRREWERNPPKADFKEKREEKKRAEMKRKDPVLDFFGIR